MKTALANHNFAEYFKYYINLVEDGEILDVLEKNKGEFKELFDFLTDEQANYRYAEDKWSIKELLVHMIDTERVFCYRALSIARNDKTDLPGYDHDDFVKYSNADNRSLCDISNDFYAVREATIQLFKSFNSSMLEKEGSANNNLLTVSSIGYIIVGHANHHFKVLEEKYLNN
jgi:hypothetical protein